MVKADDSSVLAAGSGKDRGIRIYRASLEVRHYELDSFGHVNHGCYINYMEFARWKMLAEEGLTIETFERLKAWPVIFSIDIQYRKPTFMGDILDVQTRVIDHGRVKFSVEQIISHKGAPVSTATVTSVMVNDKGRPVAIPEEIQKLWGRA